MVFMRHTSPAVYLEVTSFTRPPLHRHPPDVAQKPCTARAYWLVWVYCHCLERDRDREPSLTRQLEVEFWRSPWSALGNNLPCSMKKMIILGILVLIVICVVACRKREEVVPTAGGAGTGRAVTGNEHTEAIAKSKGVAVDPITGTLHIYNMPYVPDPVDPGSGTGTGGKDPITVDPIDKYLGTYWSTDDQGDYFIYTEKLDPFTVVFKNVARQYNLVATIGMHNGELYVLRDLYFPEPVAGTVSLMPGLYLYFEFQGRSGAWVFFDAWVKWWG